MSERSSGVRVGIDVRFADAPGIGTYLRNLVPLVIASRPSWHFDLVGHAEVIRRHRWHDFGNVAVRDVRAAAYTLREQLSLLRLRRYALHAFWSPHYNIPALLGTPLMVTVHDVAHLARPEYAGRPVRRAYARTMFELVRRRAAAIVTVSEFTRQEFRRLVGEPGAPIVVAPNGVDPVWFAADCLPNDRGSQVERPYLLCIAALKPHKNLPLLIRAFERIRDVVPHDLVIVGRQNGLRTTERSPLSAGATPGRRIRYVGEVSQSELVSLVRGAAALVHPSLYEGFGLPPLEAMASGCPCIVARAASLPEVCGDAAVYFDPTDPADLSRRMVETLTNRATLDDLAVRGRSRAALFQWEQAASVTVAQLERIVRFERAPSAPRSAARAPTFGAR